MKEQIRNFNDWQWSVYEVTFKGLPLKHVVDHLLQYSKVKHEKECPTQTHEPLWTQFHQAGNNIDMKYSLLDGISFPE